MIKVDLHTHSVGSKDGSLNLDDYSRLFSAKALDYIAITDHDTIDFALIAQSKLGQRIIVGQEVTTSQGEIIGLFLSKKVSPGQTARSAAQDIRNQGGLVYIPHPFETVRSGITKSDLDQISDLVDIVEVHNARAFFQNKGPMAATWARLNSKSIAASSDAHGLRGIGTTLTVLGEPPTAKNLVSQLTGARLTTKRPPLSSLLYPKLNRLRGKIRSKS